MVLLKNFCFAFFLLISCAVSDNNKILLKDLQVITLLDGQYTTGRRSSPVPQIQCDSGCSFFFPSQIQCYNVGFDGTDVNWKCEGDLPTGTKFSSTSVSCEGYDYPTDPYILVGSCGVIVSLSSSSSSFSSIGDFLFLLFILCFVFAIVFLCFQKLFQSSPSYIPVATTIDPNYTYPSAPPMTSSVPVMNTGNGGGGFWSGMGTGGLLGYMFGRSSRGPSWGGGGYRSHYSHFGSRPSISMTRQTGYARTQRR